MFVLPFFLAAAIFFLILWVADLFFTLKSTEAEGKELEINPFMRLFLGVRRRFLWLFKGLEIIVFLLLIYSASNLNADSAVYALLSITLVYLFIVYSGMRLYSEITKNFAPVALVFLAVSLVALGFVYLNYKTFSNTSVIASALVTCGEEYAKLQSSCSSINASGTPLPSGIPQFPDLDILIPR